MHFGEDLRLVFIQTGDHKIPAHKFWFSIAGNIEKEVTKKGGSAFGHQERVFGKIFTRAWVVVQGTVNQEVPTTKKKEIRYPDTQ